MARSGWLADTEQPGFEALTLSLAPDDEGEVVTTLIRLPAAPSARVLLYLHGWNAYFHHPDFARFCDRHAIAFYALDLRKYGRSLRPWQTPGYVCDLATYDEDIAAALSVIEAENPGCRLALAGHSTGGLTAGLWARRHPGRAEALILISPWLELQGSVPARLIVTPALQTLKRLDPLAKLPQVDPGFYGRTLNRELGGEWDYRLDWQPSPQFPVRAGWLRAITEGHATVAAGLNLQCPVLVQLATRSYFSARWSEAMRVSDIVIDVAVTAERATRLGSCVTLVRVPGAMHDIPLSQPTARARAYEHLERWIGGYFAR